MNCNERNQEGFTLIELVVTMAISSIFFTLAMHMFGSANGAFLSYKKAHDEYFKYNVKKAQAEKMIRSNPSECDIDGNYFFTGEQADSLNKAFPFPSPKCAAIDKKRSLVYSFGQYDSTSRAVNGFSTIFLNVPLHP